MISERLEEFLSAYCDADSDPDELTALMHRELGAHERSWLLPELDTAIADRALSPELAEFLTNVRFETRDEVTDWLRGLRKAWYGDGPS
ncbi:hypothetical protein AB0M20_02105 [Actinoplanes sp. NPDC051633]|uniref:hypothetical protein n=1 Tax=Actinoplanes sp. NPDC051633 TaxID=3155670 RepID=UPI00341AC34B